VKLAAGFPISDHHPPIDADPHIGASGAAGVARPAGVNDQTFRVRIGGRLLPTARELAAGQMIHHLVNRAAILMQNAFGGNIFPARTIALGNNIDHCLSPLISWRRAPYAGVNFF
jgi:hypothetical protein